jgi:hypothetical protein
MSEQMKIPPQSSMGMEEDLPPGERLIECFRLFIKYLAASEQSRQTIQERVDNIWALGGTFISELNCDPSTRKRPVDRAVREMIRYGAPFRATPTKNSSRRSTLPARCSGGSSARRLADARHHPQFLRRGFLFENHTMLFATNDHSTSQMPLTTAFKRCRLSKRLCLR